MNNPLSQSLAACQVTYEPGYLFSKRYDNSTQEAFGQEADNLYMRYKEEDRDVGYRVMQASIDKNPKGFPIKLTDTEFFNSDLFVLGG